MMVIGQENYIKTTVYRDSLVQKPQVNITYFDGLGRPIQKIAHQQSGTGLDIITPIEFDAFGRQVREYLPYVPKPTDPVSLDYRSNALQVQPTFSQYVGQVSYSEKLFEDSPLNRVVKQAAPGNDWAMPATPSDPDHTVKFDYVTNAENEVKLYTAVATWNSTNVIYEIAFGENGSNYYLPNELYKTVIKDENWDANINTRAHTTEEFKDKEGRVVLKRTYSNSMIDSVTLSFETHDTYYVYDQYGNLTYVIPPLVTDITDADQLNGLCYQYKYDYRNRLVEKKLPGKQWEFIVYDKLDRVVITAPAFNPFGGNQTGMLVTRYDAFNRPVYTGWIPKETITLATRQQLQHQYNQAPNVNEHRMSSNTIDNVIVGYSSIVSLEPELKLLTVNYYDDYNFPNAQPVPTTVIYNQKATTKTKGLATGSWVRILESSATAQSELTTTFYDDLKYRPILSFTRNYLSGFTEIKNKYAFDGLVLLTETNHKRDSHDDSIRIIEEFEYSDQGRLINHFHTINNLDRELITHNAYDELGQLINKNVGGPDVTTYVGLQNVHYEYNIRGWMTAINNVDNLNTSLSEPTDLFAFKINYNEPDLSTDEMTLPLYNGNISQTFWRTAGDDIKRKYGYQYDDLNRLTNAVYMRSNTIYNSYDETLSYDKNGNIMSLIRNGNLESIVDPAIEIDNLTYNYTANSNQLLGVIDNTNDPVGFKDDSYASDEDYVYDDNGNMVSDTNKGIEQIVYNHLNLPTLIDFGTSGTISYLYDATGRKVRKTVANSTVSTITDYMNGFQYTDGALNFFPHAEGFVNVTFCETCHGSFENTVRFAYAYNYTDHLGNIRLTYGWDETDQELKILEENHYYPFGLKHSHYNTEKNKFDFTDGGSEALKIVQVSSTVRLPYKYKYNGKEFQDELGLNFYDYGARNYDPAIGRWMNIDPLTERGYEYSPFIYSFNNPVFFLDPNGMWPIYSQDGKYLGDDGRKEKGKDLAFVGVVTKRDKKGNATEFGSLNQFTDNHTDFTKASGKISKESSGNKTESLWIAHTANNASQNKDTSQGDNAVEQMLSSNYSTTSANASATSDNSSKTNNARAALIDVLTGGNDPTGGAVLWDGKDFLESGLSHNKFSEYNNVTISGNDLSKFIKNQNSLYGTSVSNDFYQSFSTNNSQGRVGHAGTFISVNQGNNTTYYNLQSAGVKGGTLFWKIEPKN